MALSAHVAPERVSRPISRHRGEMSEPRIALIQMASHIQSVPLESCGVPMGSPGPSAMLRLFKALARSAAIICRARRSLLPVARCTMYAAMTRIGTKDVPSCIESRASASAHSRCSPREHARPYPSASSASPTFNHSVAVV